MFLKEIDQADAESQGKDRVSEKGQRDVDRQPEAFQRWRQFAGIFAKRKGSQCHEKGERSDDGAQDGKPALQLYQQKYGHHDPAVKGKRFTKLRNRGKTGLGKMNRQGERVNDEPAKQNDGREPGDPLPERNNIRDEGSRGDEINDRGQSQQREIHKAESL